jgi:hypothetical protein
MVDRGGKPDMIAWTDHVADPFKMGCGAGVEADVG